MILYRPVGTAELKLIEESGFRLFPPRLPEQPIFYPVLNEKYAREIAERWNVKDTPDLKLMMNTFLNLKFKLLAEVIIKNYGYLPKNLILLISI